jgi:putative transposase
MSAQPPDSHGYRFPPEIISYAVWLYPRFCLSFRDVEELLTNRGVTVSYEVVCQWCWKFGPSFAKKLRYRQGRLDDIWHLDEVCVAIQGKRHYLWRAVDQEGRRNFPPE